MSTFESVDSRITINKKEYLNLPYKTGTLHRSTSYVCFIKGVTYPLARYRSDPFKKAGIARDEITNALNLLSNEGIVEKPIFYSDEKKIYLFTDVRFYDLLFDLSYIYNAIRPILEQIWELRVPVEDEKRWLERIEGDSKVSRVVQRSNDYRKKITYYKRKRLLSDLIKKTSTNVNTWEKIIETQHQETLADQRYIFIIDEMRKLVLPNWLRRIKLKFSDSR
jgi:hypothetical protein